MKLTDIISSWTNDSAVDDLNLDLEGAKISKLHSKYIALLSSERSNLRSLNLKRRKLLRMLREYYTGASTQEDLEEMNRNAFPQRILKTEVGTYIEGDDLLLELDTKIALQEEKMEVLMEIMKSINGRNFVIKSMIDWKKLMLG
ncbi:MAG: hypothetical protein EBU08_13340 [Micrococcales bacterium]|nr:hypothetical protein [Micrococcales bacterium]